MKRDMDLVRAILMQLEDAPFDGGPLRMAIQTDHSPDEITYHIMLLHEAGLIKAFDFSTEDMATWVPAYLTSEGHEFLEAARDEGRWNKTKALIKSRGGAMGFTMADTQQSPPLVRRVYLNRLCKRSSAI